MKYRVRDEKARRKLETLSGGKFHERLNKYAASFANAHKAGRVTDEEFAEGITVGILTFGINSGAYVAEIIRGGIMSVDNGQFEAGRSLGFNYVQTMLYIVIPQVFKSVLPALLNEFIALLKETSVAGYVGIMDLTKAGDLIRGRTFSAFMPLIAVALVYLIIVMLLTSLVGQLERRLRKSER